MYGRNKLKRIKYGNVRRHIAERPLVAEEVPGLGGTRCLCRVPGSCRYCDKSSEMAVVSTITKFVDNFDEIGVNIKASGGTFVLIGNTKCDDTPGVAGLDVQRVGARQRNLRLRIRGRIYATLENELEVNPQLIRLSIIYDRQPVIGEYPLFHTPKQVLPDNVDVWNAFDLDGAPSGGSVISPLNPFNSQRFAVVWERFFSVPGIGIGGLPYSGYAVTAEVNNRSTFLVDEYMSIEGFDSHYAKEVVMVLTKYHMVSAGAFYLHAIGDEDIELLTPPAWRFEYNIRFEFID